MSHSFLSQLGRRSEAPPISWLMEMSLARPKLISLAAGFTDNASLPVEHAHELVKEILGTAKTGQAALQYGTTAGDPLLRELTAQNLQKLDGAKPGDPLAETYAPENLLITNGSQQLLYMLSEALCDPGDIVLLEDPTYFVYLGIAQSHGLRCRGIRLERDGIDLKQLEEMLIELKRNGDIKRVKLLYLVTYYQNPTGFTTSFAKKQAALELLRQYEKAAGHPIYLLEDAAYRELRFAGEDTPSALTAPGFADRIIYAGTYSKPFATGIRVGFGILPEPLRTVVLRIKGNHDFGSANLLQQLLIRALATGKYDDHLKTLRQRYGRKAKVMDEAMHEHFPKAVEWTMPQGGLYHWARLPRRLKSGAKSLLFQTALENDVLYVPGQICYASDKSRPQPNHEMRLSFGGASEPNIRLGIAHLGKALHQLLDQ